MRGEVVGGRFELRESLGLGGMGQVWRAWDRQTGTPVALKRILHAPDPHGTATARFVREAATAGALRHRGVVRVLSHGQDVHGAWYLVMELVEGRDLSVVLAEDGPASVSDAAGWMWQVADALGAVHAAGIVHRDLKPSNLRLTAAGSVKLLDFGIARFTEAGGTVTATGMVAGTTAYTAPERLEGGHPGDVRSDLYAFGCVLYELLTGKPPFTGPPAAQILAHLRDTPVPVAKRRPGVPGALDVLIGRLLAKDPAERPPDAVEVGRDLAVFRPTDLLSTSPRTLPDSYRPRPPAEPTVRRIDARRPARPRAPEVIVRPVEQRSTPRPDDVAARPVATPASVRPASVPVADAPTSTAPVRSAGASAADARASTGPSGTVPPRGVVAEEALTLLWSRPDLSQFQGEIFILGGHLVMRAYVAGERAARILALDAASGSTTSRSPEWTLLGSSPRAWALHHRVADGDEYFSPVTGHVEQWKLTGIRWGSRPIALAGHGDMVYSILGLQKTQVVAALYPHGQVRWAVDLPSPPGLTCALEDVRMVADASVLCVRYVHDVFGLHPRTGRRLWQTTVGSAPGTGPHRPIIDGRRLLLLAPDRLVALDKRSGVQVWEHRADFAYAFEGRGRSGRRCLAVADNRVLVAHRDGLVALDSKTGALAWHDQGICTRKYQTPVVSAADGFAYTFHDPYLGGYSPSRRRGEVIVRMDPVDGTVHWLYSLANLPEALSMSDGALVPHGDRLYIPTIRGLYAVALPKPSKPKTTSWRTRWPGTSR